MDENKSGLYIVAIVGVIAVVALVVLVINTGREKAVYLGTNTGQADRVGNAFARVVSYNQTNNNTNTTPTCYDSDGGQDYYVKGTVIYNYNGVTSIVTDFCSGGYVNEAFCFTDGNGMMQFGWSGTTCPKGCIDGACSHTLPPTNDCTGDTSQCV